MTLLFIGFGEVLFIMLAVLLLFGAKALPETARTLGKVMRTVKKATDEIKQELDKELRKPTEIIQDSINDTGIKNSFGLDDYEKSTDNNPAKKNN